MSLLKRVREWVSRRSKGYESGDDYDGLLSYAAEWHALAHGVYLGFTTKPWRTPNVPTNPDVEKESHYYRGGYVIGSLVQVGMLAGLAALGYQVGF